MAKDLRTFIHQLSTVMPDEIRMVADEADPRFGVTAIAGKLAQEGKFPALYFTRLKGSSLPLVINLTASYERLALALGSDIAEWPGPTASGRRNPFPLKW